MEHKIEVEPDAWATKDMCIGPHYGKVHFDRLPIQSINPLQYTHEKLYSEKTVIGLLETAYEAGKKDGWEACETCHRGSPNADEANEEKYNRLDKEFDEAWDRGDYDT